MLHVLPATMSGRFCKLTHSRILFHTTNTGWLVNKETFVREQNARERDPRKIQKPSSMTAHSREDWSQIPLRSNATKSFFIHPPPIVLPNSILSEHITHRFGKDKSTGSDRPVDVIDDEDNDIEDEGELSPRRSLASTGLSTNATPRGDSRGSSGSVWNVPGRSNLSVVMLFIAWYLCSMLSNTYSKAILDHISLPLTLTIAQFAFISVFCLILIHVFGVTADAVTLSLIRKAFPVAFGNVIA
jgi:hypothetical protein